MYKTLFAQADYNREKKYTVLTKLISENRTKYVTKEPVFPEGDEHINAIYQNYLLLSKSSHKFELPSTKLLGNVLKLEFIDGTNIESLIEEFLMKGKISDANSLVGEIITFLNSFPVVKDNPYIYSDFILQFDPKKLYFEEKKIDCWKPGFHDINFDNIIRKNDKYYFVDFEWCFEYPLPKEYLLLRTIFYLSIKLKKRIQLMTSPEFRCLNIFDDIYIPIEWLKGITHSADKFQKMLDYEYNLLSSIFIYYPKLEKIKKNYETSIIESPLIVPGDSISVLMNTLDKNKEEITHLKSQLASSISNINTLQSSLKSKDEMIMSHNKNIEELREINRKYQSYSYKIIERFEASKIAKFKPLRILLRKSFSLLIRMMKLLKLT